MKEIIDTYSADVYGSYDGQTLRSIGQNLGLEPDKFWDVEKAREEVNRIAEETGMKINYALTSLGTWRNPGTGEYLSIDGDWGEIGEDDPEEFFRQINNARFELRREGCEVPGNEKWYAKIGGHFPEKLLPMLERHSHLFDGIKIGAFRPVDFDLLDMKYKELWEFCEEMEWPVLIHCSASNDQDCFRIFGLAQRYPRARFCASHMGGDNPEKIEERIKYLRREKTPHRNFFLNTAVKDLEMVRKAISIWPKVLDSLVMGADIPFLGDNYSEAVKRMKDHFSERQLGKIIANGKRFMGRTKNGGR